MEEKQQDRSYKECIAGDVFAMIEAAREQGLDLSDGFENRPIDGQTLTLRYLFMPRAALTAVAAAMPADVRRRIKASNVLAAVDIGGKPVGMHLICVMDTPFEKVSDPSQVLAGIIEPALAACTAQIKTALASEFDTGAGGAATH